MGVSNGDVVDKICRGMGMMQHSGKVGRDSRMDSESFPAPFLLMLMLFGSYQEYVQVPAARDLGEYCARVMFVNGRRRTVVNSRCM